MVKNRLTSSCSRELGLWEGGQGEGRTGLHLPPAAPATRPVPQPSLRHRRVGDGVPNGRQPATRLRLSERAARPADPTPFIEVPASSPRSACAESSTRPSAEAWQLDITDQRAIAAFASKSASSARRRPRPRNRGEPETLQEQPRPRARRRLGSSRPRPKGAIVGRRRGTGGTRPGNEHPRWQASPHPRPPLDLCDGALAANPSKSSPPATSTGTRSSPSNRWLARFTT